MGFIREGLAAIGASYAGVNLTAATPAPAPAPSTTAAPATLPLASPWSDSHLARITVADLYPGLDVDSLPMSRSAAMRIPAIAKARHVVCATLARVPLLALRGDQRVPSTLLTAPDPEVTTAFHQRLWTADDLLFHGWSYWVVTATIAGRPSRARRVAVGDVEYHAADAEHPRPWWVVQGREYDVADVIPIQGPHEGILNMADLATIRSIERAYASAARNPAPLINLHDTGDEMLTDDEIDELLARWGDRRRSYDGATAYTPNGIEAKAIGGLDANLLIQGRNAAAVDAARYVGIPAAAVEAAAETGSSLNYTTVPARAQELVEFGLSAYAAAIEASLTAVLPYGQRAVHDFDAITRPSFKDRMDGYVQALAAGVYTTEELIALEKGQPGVQETPTA